MRSMIIRNGLVAALLLLSQAAGSATCHTWPAELYLLRHAEKLDSTDDSALSTAGWQRAGGLPKALSGVDVGAILVSDRLRTKQTALALSAATGIEPRSFPQQTEIAGLVDAICKAGELGIKAVVVVGHESTVPKIMAEIGVAPGRQKRPRFGDLLMIDTITGSVDPRRYGDCP